MRIRLAIPDRLVTPQVLEAALEATTIANQNAIAAGEAPSLTEAIRGGLRWRPEPFLDGEHFDLAATAHRRGWGDCDDLAPWLAAEMRAAGVEAVPRVRRSGPGRYHVVVQDEHGKIHDPSKWAGMRGAHTVSGAVARPAARHGEASLACIPYKGKWWCRADLPFPDALGHLASLARGRTPEGAMDRAIAGACVVGHAIGSPMVDRLASVGEALLSHADELDGYEDDVGSIFGSIAKGLSAIAKPLAHAAASAIPGGTLALDAAETALNALSKGGGKGGAAAAPPGATTTPSGGTMAPLEPRTWIYYHPEKAPGPVIVRMA